MELRKNVELIEVEYSGEGTKVTMTFLDEENGEVLEVVFNKQSYDTDKNKFIDDPDKAKKVDEWCEEYFDTEFDNLNNAIGMKKDVYHYDTFNSLWESTYPQKFDKDQVGEILTCTLTDIRDDGKMILIQYTDNETETLYQSKMTYSKYLDIRKEWFVEPVKKEKQYEKFEKKFGVPVEHAEDLIGKEVMVEVKRAFGEFTYGDIKKPAWSKK